MRMRVDWTKMTTTLTGLPVAVTDVEVGEILFGFLLTRLKFKLRLQVAFFAKKVKKERGILN